MREGVDYCRGGFYLVGIKHHQGDETCARRRHEAATGAVSDVG